ncbi:hypothetical protein ACFFTN_01525 [Aminobacter aganoensis]|uniref:Uncharacterized protein n=1 Tax=Aminobacter aganoensis TaxID=83264 RepID=A0A7X0KJV5_9HYPH|nr:hypothetical protein [Aminobacter aganoensis]MBB6353458.1 hypothetical protein [Aminobacter aganoensis]
MAGPWDKYAKTGGETADQTGSDAMPLATGGAGKPWEKYGGGSAGLSDEDRQSPIPDSLIETGKALVDGGKRDFETEWMAGAGAKIRAAREQAEASHKAKADAYGGSRFDAVTEGSHAGVFGGYDDEITAALLSPIDAAIDAVKGEGFDMGRAYTRKQEQLDDRKDARRDAFPVASGVGETAGGLALGGTLAKSGVTVAGKDLPLVGKTGAAALEGAGYGALYGSGEADPGERISGGLAGAAFGAATGGTMEVVGSKISQLLAKKNAPASTAATTSRELKDAASDQFAASEMAGVDFNDTAVERLGKRLKLAVGKPNEKLRPKTAGYLDEMDDLFTGKMSLEDFEEFRQVLGKEIKGASANDARTLGAMKRVLDDFADNARSTDFTGDGNGIKLLKKARETWAQAKKTEIVENILDNAERKGSGKYTQSGFANAVRSEMESLYTQIQKGKVKGFSDAEVSLIRQMAKGGSPSKVVNALSKFAPRGPVSITLGQLVGSMFPGGNIVVPLAGAAAGAAKDRAALTAVERLRDGVVTGGSTATAPALPNHARPFIAGGVAAEERVRERLSDRR